MNLKRRNKHYDRIDNYDLEQLVTPQDYIIALSSYRYKKVFLNEINTMIDQVNRFSRKQNVLVTLLYQNFKNDDTLASVSQSVSDSERKLYSNVRVSLNHLSAFDEEQYECLEEIKDRTTKEEKNYLIIREHIEQAENLGKENEIILVGVEKLLSEITRILMSEEPNDLSGHKELIHLI